MASSVLSQIFMIPAQCPPKNLAFSAAVSRRVSTGALFSGGSYRVALPEMARGCSLLVRAEESTDSEVQVEETGENVVILEPDEAAEISSEEKPPRQRRIPLGDIMGILNKRAVEASDSQRPIPDIRTGDIVEIKLEVPENRKRLSVYKGIVISRQNAGIHTTIRVRRIIAGVGVEIVFPIYSPNIRELKVVSHRKVRRARLYYLRDKLPRLSTFK